MHLPQSTQIRLPTTAHWEVAIEAHSATVEEAYSIVVEEDHPTTVKGAPSENTGEGVSARLPHLHHLRKVWVWICGIRTKNFTFASSAISSELLITEIVEGKS